MWKTTYLDLDVLRERIKDLEKYKESALRDGDRFAYFFYFGCISEIKTIIEAIERREDEGN